MDQALHPDAELVFPKHKRALALYADNEQGQRELHLHYREIEVVFDEPELFAFGEQLVKQSRFVAGAATGWGEGYAWPQVRELLEQLLASGVLRHAGSVEACRVDSGPLPSPVPPAPSTEVRTWHDCAALSRELVGREVELAHLELLVPLHRVLHSALDREGRQVGESNVFPPQLRVAVPTEWRTCQYAGSRFQDEYPLNVSALKSMSAHWRPVLQLTARVREAYLQRFPSARAGLCLLDAHLLACLAMGVPGYAMFRERDPIANAQLHPVFSSLVRITDGIRMTCTEMFTSGGEGQPVALGARITGPGLYETAERTDLMLSTYGVCAAPRPMIEEFLAVFFEGDPDANDAIELEPEVGALLDQLGPALEYGLHAMRVFALASYSWAGVAESYQRLLAVLEAHATAQAEPSALQLRLEPEWARLQQAGLGSADGRHAHRALYAAMLKHCEQGLGRGGEALAPARAGAAAATRGEAELRAALHDRLRVQLGAHGGMTQLAQLVVEHVREEQALLRRAERAQAEVNRVLGRAPARHALRADLFALGHRMRHPAARLPYLMDALQDVLGLRIGVEAEAVVLEA